MGLEAGFLTGLNPDNWATYACLQQAPEIIPSPLLQGWDYKHTPPALHVGLGDLNSGPYIFKATTLPAEPCAQPPRLCSFVCVLPSASDSHQARPSALDSRSWEIVFSLCTTHCLAFHYFSIEQARCQHQLQEVKTHLTSWGRRRTWWPAEQERALTHREGHRRHWQ